MKINANPNPLVTNVTNQATPNPYATNQAPQAQAISI